MKKITILFLLVSSFIYSQDEPMGTTFDEYNYMTKGYKIQVDSGLDMKKGYKIEDITEYSIDSYDFVFKSLLRDKTNTVAGIIVIATSKTWGNVYYLGIPLSNSKLSDDFNSKLTLWDEPMVTAYACASNYLMINFYNMYFLKKVFKK